MGLFSRINDQIDKGVEEFNATPQAWLLDCRMATEYRDGHIPHSKNVPLSVIERAETVVKDKAMPVFVYAGKASHSRQAVSLLKRMGYTDVRDLGALNGYTGKLVC